MHIAWRNHRALIALIIIILLQAGISIVFSLSGYYELKKSAYDGALYLQLFSNVLNANGLVTTIAPPHVEQSWLGFHFSPILYLMLPFYMLFPNMEMLLSINASLIALAAIPVFLAAKHLLASSLQALAVACIYLINPFVMNAQLWDFHEVTFAPVCIATLMLAVITKNRLLFLLCGAVLLCIKEHYGLAVFGAGILWAWRWKEYRFGALVSAVGIAALLCILFVIMPQLSSVGVPAMMKPGSDIDRYSWLFDPFSDISPLPDIMTMGLFYGFLLLLPYMFLPLRCFMWLLPSMADVGVNFLSSSSMQTSIYSYHSAAVIPVLTIAFAAVIARHYNQGTRLKRPDILIVSAIFSLFLSYSYVALPLNEETNIWELSSPVLSRSASDKVALEKIERLIGKTDSVSAQNNVVPLLKVHRQMYHYPNMRDTQYIVLHTGFPYKKRYEVFSSPYSVAAETYFHVTYEMLDNPDWGIAFYEHDWLVLKRGEKSDATVREHALQRLRAMEAQALSNKPKEPSRAP